MTITDDSTTFETQYVLSDIAEERKRQDAKWGVQDHPNGTSGEYLMYADLARDKCEFNAKNDELTWLDILDEEQAEAAAETDDLLLRAELVQSAAVICAWIENIDRRAGGHIQAHIEKLPEPDWRAGVTGND